MKSRLHLFRWDKGPASREAVRMREALVAARAAGADGLDLDFGLGLYDYYADTLPRFFRLVAFVLRIPGGDRERGLERVARVARGGSLFHDDEARVQMYDIHSYFEHEPDRAVHWIREMWRRHPGWPIWGLKLAQLLGEPMGLWAESAAVARDIVGTAEAGRHPNYQPVVAAMARVLLAEALLGDLRFEEAREAASARALGRARDAVGRRAGGAGARALPRPRAPGGLSRGASRSRCSRRRGGCASRATRPPPRRRAGGRSRPSRRATRAACARPGRACARDGPRRRESSRARSSTARGRRGCGPPRASCSRGRSRARASARGRSTSTAARGRQPLGREELRAEAAAAIRRLDPAPSLPDAPPLER